MKHVSHSKFNSFCPYVCCFQARLWPNMLTNRKAADEIIKYESVQIHFHAFYHLVSLLKIIISDPVYFIYSLVMCSMSIRGWPRLGGREEAGDHLPPIWLLRPYLCWTAEWIRSSGGRPSKWLKTNWNDRQVVTEFSYMCSLDRWPDLSTVSVCAST